MKPPLLMVVEPACAKCPTTAVGTTLVLTRYGWLCGKCWLWLGSPGLDAENDRRGA